MGRGRSQGVKEHPDKKLAELTMQTGDLFQLMQKMTSSDEHDWNQFIFIGAKAASTWPSSATSSAAAAAAASGSGDGGGSSSDSAKPASSPANIERKKEIVALLNLVPVFTLGPEGRSLHVEGRRDGEHFIPWMVDGSFAMKTLNAHAQRQRARLTAQPLGGSSRS